MEEPKSEQIIQGRHDYSEEESMTMINAMVRNVSKRYGMSVKIEPEGSGTFFNWHDVFVGLDARDFKRAPEAWLGAMAHEGRHVDKSRFQVIPLSDRSNPTFNLLIQLLEDRFINYGIDKDYPGAGNWLRVYYKEISQKGERLNIESEAQRLSGKIGFLPRFAEYTIALSREWAFGEIGFEMSEDAKAAWEKTSEYVLQYQKDDLPSTASEHDKNSAQLARYFICKNHIFPVFSELYEKDMENMQELFFLKYLASPEGELDAEIIELDLNESEKVQFREKIEKMKEVIREEMLEKLRSPETTNKLVEDPWKMSESLKEKLKESREQIAARKAEELKRLAEELKKGFEDMMIRYFRSKLQNPDFQMTNEEIKKLVETGISPSASTADQKLPSNFGDESEEDLEKGAKLYRSDLYAPVAGIIDELSSKFDEVLIPNKFPRWVRGYPSGGRGNVENVMQFKATRQGYNKLFERKTNPEKYDIGVALALDLSTSMNGYEDRDHPEDNRLINAKKGVAAMGEVLDRKGFQFEIVGYPVIVGRGEHGEDIEGIIVLKSLNEPFSDEVKSRIARVKAIISSTPANMAVDEISKRMDKFSASELVIINLTDGAPNDQDSLVESIKTAAGKGRTVVGLGIGNGVDEEQMTRTYKISRVAKQIRQLPSKMAEVLSEIVLHKGH